MTCGLYFPGWIEAFACDSSTATVRNVVAVAAQLSGRFVRSTLETPRVRVHSDRRTNGNVDVAAADVMSLRRRRHHRRSTSRIIKQGFKISNIYFLLFVHFYLLCEGGTYLFYQAAVYPCDHGSSWIFCRALAHRKHPTRLRWTSSTTWRRCWCQTVPHHVVLLSMTWPVYTPSYLKVNSVWIF